MGSVCFFLLFGVADFALWMLTGSRRDDMFFVVSLFLWWNTLFSLELNKKHQAAESPSHVHRCFADYYCVRISIERTAAIKKR